MFDAGSAEDRDWNELFQTLLERPTETPEDARRRDREIGRLVGEFVEAAKPFVQARVFYT
jgi:hypothetical protein